MGNNITIENKIASLNDALKQVFLDMKTCKSMQGQNSQICNDY